MKTAYSIYVLLCMGVGVFLQHGEIHPDYLLGGFYGAMGSWLGPGILLETLLGHSHNLLEMLGGSLVFWLIAGLLYKGSSRKQTKVRPRGRGPAVNTSAYDVLPDLPPGLGYYTRPTPRTTRTAYIMDEEE